MPVPRPDLISSSDRLPGVGIVEELQCLIDQGSFWPSRNDGNVTFGMSAGSGLSG